MTAPIARRKIITLPWPGGRVVSPYTRPLEPVAPAKAPEAASPPPAPPEAAPGPAAAPSPRPRVTFEPWTLRLLVERGTDPPFWRDPPPSFWLPRCSRVCSAPEPRVRIAFASDNTVDPISFIEAEDEIEAEFAAARERCEAALLEAGRG